MKTKTITINGEPTLCRALKPIEIILATDVCSCGTRPIHSRGMKAGDFAKAYGRYGCRMLRPLPPAKKAKLKPWGSFKLKPKKKAGVKRVIEDGDYHKGLLRIASILNRNLTNDHKIGMIDEVLFALLITPIPGHKEGKK